MFVYIVPCIYLSYPQWRNSYTGGQTFRNFDKKNGTYLVYPFLKNIDYLNWTRDKDETVKYVNVLSST